MAFLPESKIMLPHQRLFSSLCFAACGSMGHSLDIPKLLQSSRENRLPKPRARALQPLWKLPLDRVHGPSSSGRVQSPQDRQEKIQRWKHCAVRRQGILLGFCCFCSLTVQGCKPRWTKDTVRKLWLAAPYPLSSPS